MDDGPDSKPESADLDRDDSHDKDTTGTGVGTDTDEEREDDPNILDPKKENVSHLIRQGSPQPSPRKMPWRGTMCAIQLKATSSAQLSAELSNPGTILAW